MSNCPKSFITGDVVRYHVENTLCADTVPTEEQWKTLATLTGKTLNTSTNMLTDEGDDNTSGFQSNQGTQKTQTISLSGNMRSKLVNADLLHKIYRDYINSKNDYGMWVRHMDANVIVRGFYLIASMNIESPTNGFQAWTLELVLGDGDSVLAIDAPVV
jgi:predicted secreted protein